MLKTLRHYQDEIIVFLLTFCWLSLHWLSTFPALYSWDIFFYHYQLFEKNMPWGFIGWESSLYNLYVYFMASFSPRMTIATLFQIVFLSYLVSVLFQLIKTELNMRILGFFVVGLFILAPPNVFFALMTERDNLFAWFGCLGLIEFFKLTRQKNDERSISNFFKVFSLFALMAALRRDALLILVILPLLFFGIRTTINYKKIFMAYFATIAIIGAYTLLMTQFSRNKAFGMAEGYNVNAVFSSFMYIAALKKDSLSPEEKIVLYEHIEPKILVDPNAALWTNVSEMKKIYDGTKLQKFYGLVFKLFSQHPLLFLESRWKIFLFHFKVVMFLSPSSIGKEQDYSFANPYSVREKFNMISENLVPELSFLKDYFLKSHDVHSFWFWFSSPIWALVLCIIAFFCFAFAPAASSLSAIALLHELVVFLFQPAGGCKYTYFVYTSVFIIIPVLIFEAKKNWMPKDSQTS